MTDIFKVAEDLENVAWRLRRLPMLEGEIAQLRAENDRLTKLVTALGGEGNSKYDRSRHHLWTELLIDGETLAFVRNRQELIAYHAAKLAKEMERAIKGRFDK